MLISNFYKFIMLIINFSFNIFFSFCVYVHIVFYFIYIAFDVDNVQWNSLSISFSLCLK